MENETSIKAVDMAIAFGEGRATMEELKMLLMLLMRLLLMLLCCFLCC
jgi:hypothetical protein